VLTEREREAKWRETGRCFYSHVCFSHSFFSNLCFLAIHSSKPDHHHETKHNKEIIDLPVRKSKRKKHSDPHDSKSQDAKNNKNKIRKEREAKLQRVEAAARAKYKNQRD